MSQSVLSELFFDRLQTREYAQSCFKQRWLSAQICELDERLRSLLNDKQLNVYKKLIDTIQSLDLEGQQAIFADGFSLGLRLGLEALSKPDLSPPPKPE